MRIRCHGKKMDTITIKRKIEKVVDEIYHETVIKKGDPDWDFWHPLICELQGRDYYDTPTAKAVCPLVQSERSIRRHLAHARQAVMKEHPEMDLSWVTPHGFRHDFTSRKREEGYSDAEIDSKWTAQVEVKNVGRYGVGA